MNWRILQGDAVDRLRELDAQSVQTCVTSPPYFALRDYGHDGQIGLESSPSEYVARLVAVFREVRHALTDDGTLWLNLGDSYAGSWGAQGRPQGASGEMATRSVVSARQIAAHPKLKSRTGTIGSDWGCKPKDLIGIPWRVAFALQADGWYLRSDIIWSKPNPMPESVTDRPTKAHEYIFLLSKSSRYYYDAAAIAEASIHAGAVVRNDNGKNGQMGQYGQTREGFMGEVVVKSERNKRSVWHVATQPYPEAHFATYPEKLIEPCILAGSKPGDTVLDPFTGSGTTGAVAIRHQRNFIGCELNPEYVKLAEKRIGGIAPLFSEQTA